MSLTDLMGWLWALVISSVGMLACVAFFLFVLVSLLETGALGDRFLTRCAVLSDAVTVWRDRWADQPTARGTRRAARLQRRQRTHPDRMMAFQANTLDALLVRRPELAGKDSKPPARPAYTSFEEAVADLMRGIDRPPRRYGQFRELVHVLALLALPLLFVGYLIMIPPKNGAAPDLPPVTTGERIDRFDVAYHVRDDGVVEVRETIDYDFGARPRPSFQRLLVTEGGIEDRSTNGLAAVHAHSAEPARTTVHTYPPNHTNGSETLVTIRPRDGDTWRGGGHRFVVEYELRRVAYAGGEIRVDPLGDGFRQPIAEFDASVTGDHEPGRVSCDITGSGAPCKPRSVPPDTRVFLTAELAEGQQPTLTRWEAAMPYLLYLGLGFPATAALLLLVFVGLLFLTRDKPRRPKSPATRAPQQPPDIPDVQAIRDVGHDLTHLDVPDMSPGDVGGNVGGGSD